MAQLLGGYSLKESNITVFGDSISKGLYLKGDRINRLEINAVQLVMDKYGIDIDNKSAFGQSLQRIYNKKVIEKYLAEIDYSRHNIAVLSLGGNDADYNWTEVAKNPTAIHDSKTPLFFFGKWLDETIRMLQSNGVHVVITSLPPVNSQRYFDNVIARHCDREAVLRFLHDDVSNISRHQECFSNLLMQRALFHGCGFVDLRTAFLMKNDFLNFLCMDGIHPNERGQALIARTMFNHIESRRLSA